jgi:hypothetical protein
VRGMKYRDFKGRSQSIGLCQNWRHRGAGGGIRLIRVELHRCHQPHSLRESPLIDDSLMLEEERLIALLQGQEKRTHLIEQATEAGNRCEHSVSLA